jgi:hypothetical protein
MVIIWLMMVNNLVGGAIAILKNMNEFVNGVGMTSHMFSWENNGGFSIATLDYRMVIHTKSQEVHFLTSWNQPATNLMLICHLPSGHDYISRYHQISTNPVKSTSD